MKLRTKFDTILFQKIIFVFTRNLSYNKKKYVIDSKIGKE